MLSLVELIVEKGGRKKRKHERDDGGEILSMLLA
jgi:hypothetical protein